MNRFFLFLLVFSLPIGALGQRNSSAPLGPGGQRVKNALLERTLRAQPKLRYVGTRRMLMRLGPETRSNIERVWQDGLRSRVEFAEGSDDLGQVIVIANGYRSHFFPNSNEIQLRPVRPNEGEMVRSWPGTQIKEGAGGIVAGQRTTLLSFFDQGGNATSKLWIDPESAMVLKRELYDPSGRLVGSMEFLRIDFSPTFDESDFKITRRGAKLITMKDVLKAQAATLGFRPLHLPETTGLLLDSVRTFELGQGARAIGQTYFSRANGRRVSLYITKREINTSRLRRMQGHQLASVSKVVGDLNVILIGNLPEAELQKLADQVK